MAGGRWIDGQIEEEDCEGEITNSFPFFLTCLPLNQSSHVTPPRIWQIIRYFPQGVLEIMCNYPPDILFTTCPTPSYDCSGTTTLIADLSKASRAPPSRCRILLSPGRRLVKISIRRSFPEESGVNSETELGYRSRRQIKLRRDDGIVEQLQGTLQEQIGGVRNGKNRWVDEEVAVLRDFISLSAYWQ